VVGTYAFGRGGTGLEGDWSYVLPATLGALWIAVGLNIVGLRTGRWLQNLGAVGAYLPGLLLVALGVYAAFTRPPATPMTPATLLPDLGDFSSLNLWASIAFAFAGLELCAVLGDEVKEPRRNLPRSIMISAPLIAFLYIAGTVSVLWLVPTGEVNIVSGFLQALAAGAADTGLALAWLAPTAAALYVVGNIGGVGAWLTGPARVAFVIGLDRYFPPAFGKVHPRWHTPYVAILTQAVLASVFLLVSVIGRGTTVERAYLIILDTMLLVYFIPYIYLFLCYLKDRLRAPDAASAIPARAKGWIIGLSGLTLTLLAMFIATVPPAGTEQPWLFRVKVIGGAGAFVLLGGVLFLRKRR
jgi:glutamate:GABA antiporter